ncbi:hypothetical protein QQS21_010934 [Conoideocrella luteorostrata]|uniref:Carrier domain-containing protein n=1 Tax=Conoideocrella luteorostrata TaxID=1105319 RepID=A0AAJ0FTR7_9HYPO|nr:hypothetical protein QQS21_010934 [Conoideocrella luteorostrata]
MSCPAEISAEMQVLSPSEKNGNQHSRLGPSDPEYCASLMNDGGKEWYLDYETASKQTATSSSVSQPSSDGTESILGDSASAQSSSSQAGQFDKAGDDQERPWRMQRQQSESKPLSVWASRIRGPVQLEMLKSAIAAVGRCHALLGKPIQCRDDNIAPRGHLHQLSEPGVVKTPSFDEQALEEVLRAEQNTPLVLDLEPYWRVTIYHRNAEDHLLSISFQNTIFDNWTAPFFYKKLTALYSAAVCGQDLDSMSEPGPQWHDYVAKQRQKLQTDRYRQQLQYWATQLETSRAAELLCDYPRPVALTGNTNTQSFQIDDSLYLELKKYCQERKTSSSVVLLAALRAAHYRLTGDGDATIGNQVIDRNSWETKDMMLPLTDIQCIRTRIEDESFDQLVDQVQNTMTAASEKTDVRFEDIVSCLQVQEDPSRHPLVQCLFVMVNQSDLGTFTIEGAETQMLRPLRTSKFDVELHIIQEEVNLRGEVIFSTDLYELGTIEALISVFHKILKQGLAEPSVSISVQPLLTSDDYSRLNALDLIKIQETDYPRESSIIDVFRQQVMAVPSKPAVKDEASHLSYAELDQQSNSLAEWLGTQFLPAETLIGIWGHRSCQAIVAVLGVLKANLAYLPLDGSTPPGRVETILESIPGSKLVLVESEELRTATQVADVEFITITEVLKQATLCQPLAVTLAVLPTPTSLAYVMYTSGSTGKPKGVMVEHRGVVRLAKRNNMVQHHSPSSTIAHIASIAFDMSTWEIFTALLNGGTLVCINLKALLDCRTMADTMSREKIEVMLITPALLKRYLHECPEAISSLSTLYVGGDRTDPRDLTLAQKLVKGRVINAYGPTENTGASTVHCLAPTEVFANGVPIGRALSNSGAYVMDRHHRLVPLGVVGELVVTGDGLARGYVNPQHNVNRFISVEIAGETIRAYKTGDLVRHRPVDGELEFFGRIDQQIKIRGQRVEPGEIDHVLLNHESVNEAATVLQNEGDEVAQLTSFVTLRKSDHEPSSRQDNGSETKLVEEWKQRIVAETYTSVDSIQPEMIGQDFIGWTSMYDGSDIDKAEMREWLDDTIETILNGEAPGHVLEIGTGSGMILFNLVEGLQSYVGLEPNERVVEYVNRMAQSTPALADKVKMYRATGADLGRLALSGSPNTIIINSVVQYFPDLDYLYRVIQDILKLESVKTIFFGDVRSYALYKEFLAARALRIAGEGAGKDEIRRIMTNLEQAEMELLIDPIFFTNLQLRLPDRIAHVEILPKKMGAVNELSSYRYAAVLHVNSHNKQQGRTHELDQNMWVDFTTQQLDRQSLARLLQQQSASNSSVVAIGNITYSNIKLERAVLVSLDSKEDDILDTEWQKSLQEAVRNVPSLSAVDLVSLADKAGYCVEISWARQRQHRGAMDAVFYRSLKHGQRRTWFRFPADSNSETFSDLGTQPLRQQRTKRIQTELKQILTTNLPSYMVPQAVVVLEEMPVNANGKIDRRMLARRARPRSTGQRQLDQQSSETERRIQNVWAEALKVEISDVQLDDNFFALGGNSITAMVVAAEAHKAGVKFTVEDIFRHPVLRDLARQSTDIVKDTSLDIPQFSLLGNDADVADVMLEISEHYHLDPAAVQDAYPCTPIQEGLMSLSSRHSGAYTMQAVLELPPDVVVADLCSAWEAVFSSMPILRTRFIQHQTFGLVQLVMNDDIHWIEATGLAQYLESDRNQKLGLGQPLTRYAIVKDAAGTQSSLVWTIHHALFDAWSIRLIMDAVSQAYRLGRHVETHTPFTKFIQYVQQRDDQEFLTYWKQTLGDYDGVPFPAASLSANNSTTNSLVECSIMNPKKCGSDVTTSTLIRAALALVIGNMNDSTDVVFGVTMSGRSAPVHGIDKMAAPTIATVPIRVKLDGQKKLSDLLETIQLQATEMIPFEQSGLQRIARVCPGAERACALQTLLVVQPEGNDGFGKSDLGNWRDGSPQYWSDTYPLTVELCLGADNIAASALFDSKVIDQWTVQNLLQRLKYALVQLETAGPETTIEELELITEKDLSQIWEWNSTVPPKVEQDICQGIARWARSQPNAPAVSAWDGELTYDKLDQLVNQLAGRLIALGVGQDSLVPLCFEKSFWTTVAMLGVLRAGAGFVLLDSSLPEERLKSIVDQVDNSLILCSVLNQAISCRLAKRTIALHWELFLGLEHQISLNFQPACFSSTAYIVFTSGSTGTPKGVVISHGNLSSALHHQAAFYGLGPSSRMFGFASYSFDCCIEDALAVLTAGGCFCVPSEQDRIGNLEQSITSSGANVLNLTSSVAQLLSPASLPSVHTIIFGGEALNVADVAPWWGRARVINTYGPAECTPTSVINCDATCPEEATHIGEGAGVVTWVADPANSHKLVPPGCVGELILEGPSVGKGYLNDPQQTASAFVEDPPWLLRGTSGRSGRHGRLYKTGDLVQYISQTGALKFVGRKDVQVKIHGQRIELGEVEHWARLFVPEASQVAAEVIVPRDQGATSKIIVVYLQINSQTIETTDDTAAGVDVYPFSSRLAEKMAGHLPRYMVPRGFLCMQALPMNISGKLDRKTLRRIGASYSAEQLFGTQSRNQGSERRPTSDAELLMQGLWARVLSKDVSNIGLEDNFFWLGGDSILAMKLSAEARKAGVMIEVTDIFKCPTLVEQSRIQLAIRPTAALTTPAFGLLDGKKENFREDLAGLCGLNVSQVEDAYPCTSLQEGLLSLTAKRHGDYTLQAVFELASNINISTLKRAFEHVVRSSPVLRTRIIQHEQFGLVQVVVDECINWIDAEDLRSYMKKDNELSMGLGHSLARFSLVKNGSGNVQWFVWTLHHALYDGWSLNLMIDAVQRAYHGEKIGAGPQFQAFLQYIRKIDYERSEKYWRSKLANCECIPFPALSSSIDQPATETKVEHRFPRLEGYSKNLTISNLIRAAWALIASQMTDSNDVVFGATVSGRNAPVADIDQLMAPTFATVPVRVVLDRRQTITEYLDAIQLQTTDMVPFEQTGLHRIAKMSSDCGKACSFQTLLVIEIEEVIGSSTAQVKDEIWKWQDIDARQAFGGYALVVQVFVGADDITISAIVDSKAIEPWVVKNMLRRLEHVLQQLNRAKSVQTIEDITMIAPEELEVVWDWNSTVPASVERCVHEIIEDKVQSQPNSPAVCAWDGEITYRELSRLSIGLARWLAHLGVAPGSLIPLCFEKSMWTTVAILGVLKAGAAFVLLDPSLPEYRLQTITKQIGATTIISSPMNHALSLKLGPQVITIDRNLLIAFCDQSTPELPRSLVAPSSIMYVVFTSGSTGEPKGTMIKHQNMSSALAYQLDKLELTAESRVFDFSAYSFDMSICNVFLTLTLGGCLCVPRESDRINKLAESIAEMKATSVILTPSVSRMLLPEHVPQLQSIMFIGEALSVRDVEPWLNKVRIINLYGPCECTPISTINSNNNNAAETSSKDATRIGMGAGTVTWVVDAENHDRLLPPGCVGELVLEGPLIGNGYLNNPAKTAEVFIENPTWLAQGFQGKRGRQGRCGRVYKTGDLVRYNEDGSLVFIGRKDSQLKISGQRVESGEVEYWLQRCMPEARQVTVEMIIPDGEDSVPMLVAFVELDHESEDTPGSHTQAVAESAVPLEPMRSASS